MDNTTKKKFDSHVFVTAESISMVDPDDVKTASPFKDLFQVRPADLENVEQDMKTNGYDSAHPIIIWAGHDMTVIDGHTRLAAAKKLMFPLIPAIIKTFKDEAEALEYAITQYRPEVEVYNEAEVKQILSALMEEPIYIRAIIEVAFFTGCRRGEIVGLKWDDIDLVNHRLYVRRSIYKPHGEKAFEKPPKTRNSLRNMTIPQRLVDTLTEYKEYQQQYAELIGDKWNNLNYVFTEVDGHVMNPQTPTKQFDHFLKRHNIRHLKFHGLRHTSATMLLANGCDIKTVSMRLGHSDLDTTNIYVHSIAESDKGAADTFDRIYTDYTGAEVRS